MEANKFFLIQSFSKNSSSNNPGFVGTGKISRLKKREALKKCCLANPVISEEHGPLGWATLFINQMEGLRWSKTSDVLDC